MFMSMLDGVHRGEQGRIAWRPTIRYWWAIFFPIRNGDVSGRALTPAEREFLAASRKTPPSSFMKSGKGY